MKCPECSEVFSRPSDLWKHKRIQHGEARHFDCDKCDYTSNKLANLKRHKKIHNEAPPLKIRRKISFDDHNDTDKYSVFENSALGRRLLTYELEMKERDADIALQNSVEQIKKIVRNALESYTGIKIQIMLSIIFIKPSEPLKKKKFGFYSQQLPIFRGTDFELSDLFTKILQGIDKFVKEGSGWSVDTIESAFVHVLKYQPLRGTSFKPIPQVLKNKKAIINIKNKDQKCFMWSILAALHPVVGPHSNPNRVSNYKRYENELDFTGVEFPVDLRQINKFEEQNNLAINVYDYEDFLFPLRVSERRGCRHIHLFLYQDHYSLITSLDRLLFDQRKFQGRKFFCPRCLIPKTTQAILDDHSELCSTTDPTKVIMPEDGSLLKFKNIKNMMRQPLLIYADFECFTVPVNNKKGNFTHQYQQHIPSGYGLIESHSCCGSPTFNNPTVYRGDKVIENFLIDVMGIVNEHQEKLKINVPLQPQDCTTFNNETTCHICREPFINGDKVRDHCHICGKYRGAAHNECNQSYKLSRDVVIVFHNLRKYDGHLIMQEIGRFAKLWGLGINVIAKAMEDYISFSLQYKGISEPGEPFDYSYKIRFIDSLQFLNCSLSDLAKNLDIDQLKALGSIFKGEKFNLLRRKGVYPYDFMDGEDKFLEAQLPDSNAFYNKLNQESIKEEEYAHAQKVWKVFELSNMGEYHDLYLMTDVLLLADVFEGFRSFALDKYGLDPAHYVTTPSLAWDACLKLTKVELEHLSDNDMYLFCERGIRGGMCQIGHRYARANNPLVPGYMVDKPKSYIMYWDMNNLYGYAMIQKLPVDGFAWLSADEIKSTDFSNTDGDVGYILEVDLDYPELKHDEHSDYPLAPEPMQISEISPYSQHLKDLLGLKSPPQTKLVLSLKHKRNYIVHFKNLKLYEELGLDVKKIHRVLKFNQRAWMKPFIDFNTSMRARATNDFDKNQFKLMNNSTFGKTMENPRRYRLVELVCEESRLEKLTANPRLNSSCRFNDSLVGVTLLKPSVKLDKPIYCGLSVLDLSKEAMYRYHYTYVIPKYGARAKLLFTDTDSLCYKIETDDIYQDMAEDSHMFDFSDYSNNHPNFSTNNKKKVGIMSDETHGLPIFEFCGLRAKMYSIDGDGISKQRAKGIKKSTIRNEISHEDYVSALFNKQSTQHTMNLMQSRLHNIFSEEHTKVSLSPYDDKRWLINNIETRAHGHWRNRND